MDNANVSFSVGMRVREVGGKVEGEIAGPGRGEGEWLVRQDNGVLLGCLEELLHPCEPGKPE